MSSLRLISTRAAAELLVLPHKQVLRLAARGDLAFVQKLEGVRGGYLFDADVVSEYGRKLAEEAELRAREIRESIQGRAS